MHLVAKREVMERKGEVVERVDEETLSLDYQKNMPQRKVQLACK